MYDDATFISKIIAILAEFGKPDDKRLFPTISQHMVPTLYEDGKQRYPFGALLWEWYIGD